MPIKSSDKKNTKSVVVIPQNFNLVLITNIKKLNFEDLRIEDLKGNIIVNNGKINLQQTAFKTIGSEANIEAYYSNIGAKKANFDMQIAAKEFDIKRAYKEIKVFREMVSAAENAEGVAGLDYKISGVLNDEMFPIFPSLIGSGTVTIKNAKMKGYKMFNAINKQTSMKALDNPDIKDVVVKTTIKNNIIEIYRFKIKAAGFRTRIEGKTSFDGKLNMKIRVGLPPLGIIGIPITVTGNKDKPKIKLGKKGEEIEETEYK
jgi:AsmA protein